MNQRCIDALRAAIVMAAIVLPVSIVTPALAVGTDSKSAPAPEAAAKGTEAPPDLSETDMSHVGSSPGGSVTVPWKLLGGAVGNQAVNGVRVELFVLQAQEADKLKPGDPNHAFTVTLKDDKSGELLKEGEVSIGVAAPGGPVQPKTAMSHRSDGVFRSGVALPKPGDYRLQVAFKSAGHSGLAEFPYRYREDAVPAHHH
jgi:hypothetical protein